MKQVIHEIIIEDCQAGQVGSLDNNSYQPIVKFLKILNR